MSSHLRQAWASRIALGVLDPGDVTQISPEEFHQRFSSAMEGSPFVHHVTNHTPEEIRSGRMTPLITNGGKTGVLVHDHGDGRIEPTGLFNQSGVKGAGVDLLRHTMDHHGANYAECYGPRLPKLYNRVGFKTTEKYRFDRDQAAPGWDFRQFDSPSYHIMGLKGGKRKMAFIPGPYNDSDEEWNPDGSDEHWDDPKWVAELRRKIEAEGRAEDPDWEDQNASQADAHWDAATKAFGV